MTDQATPDAGPVLFLPAETRGRPPKSSTSTNEPQPSSTSPQTPSQEGPESFPQPDPSWSTGPHAASNDDPGHSGTSSPSPGNSPDDDARGLTERLAAGLNNAAQAAHNTLTDDVGRSYGQYLATEDELMETADAAASMLSRRVGSGVVNPDTEDLIRIGVALASYVGRQWRILKAARADRKRIALESTNAPAAAAAGT